MSVDESLMCSFQILKAQDPITPIKVNNATRPYTPPANPANKKAST